jgi:hypothetical protein
MITKRHIPAIIIASIAVIGAIAYYRSREEQKRQAELARAVALLPPGTENAWAAYVDRILARTVSIRKDGIRVRALGAPALGQTMFISRNMPWQVSCDPVMGASVEFGLGDDSIMVWVYGTMRDADDKIAATSSLAAVLPSRPPLGVDTRSIAAKRLSEVLCERIAAYLQKIMQSGSAISIKRAPAADLTKLYGGRL